MYKLENWCVTAVDPWAAPETGASLGGYVYNHPNHIDGTPIVTSRIVETEGRFVTTYTGSVYELGEPAPLYVEYLKTIHKELDPINPVKMIKKGPE